MSFVIRYDACPNCRVDLLFRLACSVDGAIDEHIQHELLMVVNEKGNYTRAGK